MLRPDRRMHLICDVLLSLDMSDMFLLSLFIQEGGSRNRGKKRELNLQQPAACHRLVHTCQKLQPTQFQRAVLFFCFAFFFQRATLPITQGLVDHCP